MSQKLAKNKFALGDRVRLSDEWVEKSTKYPRTGTVVGFSRDGRLVRVLRDDQKTPTSWGADLWDLIQGDPRTAATPLFTVRELRPAEPVPLYPVLLKPLTVWQKLVQFFTGSH